MSEGGFVARTNPVYIWDNHGMVTRATGPKSSCLCAFFLPVKVPTAGSPQALRALGLDLGLEKRFLGPLGPGVFSGSYPRVSRGVCKGRELNTNFFFSQSFRAPRDMQNLGISRQKVSLGFEGDTELFGPHPFTWKTPTPPKILGRN